MTTQQEEALQERRAKRWNGFDKLTAGARIARAQAKRKGFDKLTPGARRTRKLAPHTVAGWEQVTTFLSQHSQVATATEKLTAREWLEGEFGRLLSKGNKCKIYQHPQAPDLIALFKELR